MNDGKSRIPDNKPENKEPAEGSRETVLDEPDPRTSTHPDRLSNPPPPRGHKES